MNRSKRARVRKQRDAMNHVRAIIDDPAQIPDPTDEDLKMFDPDLVYDLLAEPLLAASSYRSNLAARALLRLIRQDYRRFVIMAYVNMSKDYYKLMYVARHKAGRVA